MRDVNNNQPEKLFRKSSRKVSKIVVGLTLILYFGILVDQPHERMGNICNKGIKGEGYDLNSNVAQAVYYPSEAKYREYFLPEYMLGCIGEHGCKRTSMEGEAISMKGQWKLENWMYWLGGRDLLLRRTDFDPLIVLSQGNKKVIIPADQFLKTFHGVSKHETDVRGIFLFLEKNLCIK